MNNEKRGEFLKKLRKSKKLTQQQLGKLINYSDKNISKWENGYSFPSDPEVLTNLSRFFNVSIEELLYGDFATPENSEKIKENTFDIYKKNYQEKMFFKKCVLITILIFLVTIIVSLLSIYFIYIKGQIHYYKLTGEPTSGNIVEGSLLLSNKINILALNKIESSKDIEYLFFYTKKDDAENTIFNGDNDNYYIEEAKGSLEYDLKSILNTDSYIKILYTDGTNEIVKLSIEEKFVNDKIFVENVSKENTEHTEEVEEAKILEQKGFVKEKEYYIKKMNNIEINYYFNKFEITITRKSQLEKISKNIYANNIIHETIKDDKVEDKSLVIEGSIDCDTKKCETTEDYYKYLNYLSDVVKK